MSLKRRARRWFSRPLLWAAIVAVPWVYHAYIALVWASSRVKMVGVGEAIDASEDAGGIVFALYHETVLLTLYPARRWKLLTVASRSDSGEVISAVIHHFGLSVARGGSSKSRRRRTPVVKQIIEHMRAHRGTVTAVTVDGSSGPRRRLKPGVLEVARETGAPLHVLHAHASPALRLPTWDRTIVPLPFCRIRIWTRGPIHVPPDAAAPQFAALKARAQALLDETVTQTERGAFPDRV